MSAKYRRHSRWDKSLLFTVAAFGSLIPTQQAVAQTLPVSNPGPDLTAQTQRKLEMVSVSLNFMAATIDEATRFLTVESKRLDPDHKGFNFVISPAARASGRPATLTLSNVTFEQALQNVCNLANVKYKIDGRIIHIFSLAENPAVPKPELPVNDKAAEATMHKLENIVIDRVNFEKLDIAAAVQFLAAKSKELDPEHSGVNFVLGNITPEDQVRRQVSMTLDQIPLSDLLFEIASQTNLHYSIGDNIVTFKP